MPALRPHRQQRHQLRGGLRRRFGLLNRLVHRHGSALRQPLRAALIGSLLAPPLLLQTAGRSEGFGRWQTSTSSCSLQRGSDASRPCQELRLEQNLSGLLSVRFLSDSSSGLLAQEQLLFAGVLEPERPAMVCDRQGQCQPRWPSGVAVATVGDSRFDERGLAIGIPQAYLALGQCSLEPRRITCQARGRDGERWTATAEL